MGGKIIAAVTVKPAETYPPNCDPDFYVMVYDGVSPHEAYTRQLDVANSIPTSGLIGRVCDRKGNRKSGTRFFSPGVLKEAIVTFYFIERNQT